MSLKLLNVLSKWCSLRFPSVSSSISLGIPRHSPSLTLTRGVRGGKIGFFHPSHRETLVELNVRRKNVELNSLLKEGSVKATRRDSYLDWNYQAEIGAFSARLGESFSGGLLVQAFTTEAQVVAEMEEQRRLGVELDDQDMQDNSKLAEQGRMLTQEALTEWLERAYPLLPGDGVSAVVSHLLAPEFLANVSFHLGCRELVSSPSYPPTMSELGTCLLAVLGALASSHQDRAKQLAIDLLAAQLQGKDIATIWEVRDPMARLAGILKERGMGEPESRLLWSSGPGTILACYTVGVYSDRQLVGESPGETQEVAEEMAARDALRRLLGLSNQRRPPSLDSSLQAEAVN